MTGTVTSLASRPGALGDGDAEGIGVAAADAPDDALGVEDGVAGADVE
jgi:hypothetical protein